MPAVLRAHWRIAIDLALYATLVTLYVMSGTVISVPLAVAQLLPLVWRRRAPGTVLAVISVATAAHSLLGMGRAVGYLPVSLAVYGAATQRSPAVRWGVCGAATVLVTVAGAIRRGPVEGGLLAAVAFTRHLAGRRRTRRAPPRAGHDRRAAPGAAPRRAGRGPARPRTAGPAAARQPRPHDDGHAGAGRGAAGTTARLAPADEQRLDTVLRGRRDALAEVRLALAEEGRQDAAATLTERLDALREAGLAVPPT